MGNSFIFNKSINEIVKKRKSIRTYNNEEISVDTINNIEEYINNIKGPFKENVIFKILDYKEHINGAKLGTYGVIKGATKFIAVKVRNQEYALEQLGYEMESLVLYITSLGIGTCWIGGTFKKGEFAKAMELEEDEILPIISPIGYECDKKSFVDNTMRKLAKCDKRKSWNEIFYFRDFSCPLTEHCSLGNFKDALQNIRLAPSALNKQPWRIVKSGEDFHFFVNIDKKDKEEDKKYHYDIKRIDMGIAMCHFDLTCKEKGLKGNFKVVDTQIKVIPKNYEYLISWIKE